MDGPYVEHAPEFAGFPKIARFFRDVIVTEKIDGTNAQILIADNCAPFEMKSGRVVPFLCGSRTRWIFPEGDNHGFARWAYENADELLKLGPGRHFGEWWGQGIQRNYGLKEKRFSLFNVTRWGPGGTEPPPACCHVVPIVWRGALHTQAIQNAANSLLETGSLAAPGFMKPEGIVVFHEAGKIGFKFTFDGDASKGVQNG